MTADTSDWQFQFTVAPTPTISKTGTGSGGGEQPLDRLWFNLFLCFNYNTVVTLTITAAPVPPSRLEWWRLFREPAPAR
jgi:hypothetical protein